MKVTAEVKQKCEDEITRCMAVAAANYPTNTFKRPKMTYELKGRTAGTANHARNLIRINGILLMENVKEMVENTVSHEFAHIVDHEVHGQQYGSVNWRTGRRKRIAHGHTFKTIMRQFGRSTSTTHNMDTSNASQSTGRTTKIHIWKCGCGVGKVTIGAKRHARMLKIASTGYGVYQRGHTANRCGNYSYFGTIHDELTPMPIAAKAPRPTNVPKARPAYGKSKLDMCRRVYNPEHSRAANIVAFTEEGCTPAGAATYYAKIKKEFGS